MNGDTPDPLLSRNLVAPTTPASILVGNVDESPNRSLVETSMYCEAWQQENGHDDGTVSLTNDDFSSSCLQRRHRILLKLIVCLLWPLGIVAGGFLFHIQEDSVILKERKADNGLNELYQGRWFGNPQDPPLTIVYNANITFENPDLAMEAQAWEQNWTGACESMHVRSGFDIMDGGLWGRTHSRNGHTVVTQVYGNRECVRRQLRNVSEFFVVQTVEGELRTNRVEEWNDAWRVLLLSSPLAVAVAVTALWSSMPPVWTVYVCSMSIATTLALVSCSFYLLQTVLHVGWHVPGGLTFLSVLAAATSTVASFEALVQFAKARGDSDPMVAFRRLSDKKYVATWIGTSAMAVSACVFPPGGIQSLGIHAVVVLGCTFLVYSVVPTILFSSRAGKRLLWQRTGRIESLASNHSYYSTSFDDALDRFHSQVQALKDSGSTTYQITKHLLHKYKGAIALLLVFNASIPLLWQVRFFDGSMSPVVVLPVHDRSSHLRVQLHDVFGVGAQHQVSIIFDARHSRTHLTTDIGFDVQSVVVDTLRTLDHRLGSKLPAPVSFTGISVVDSKAVSASLYSAAKLCGTVGCPFPRLMKIDGIDRYATAAGGRVTTTVAVFPFDPLSEEAFNWVKQAREAILQLEGAGRLRGIDVTLHGASVSALDATNDSLSVAPIILGVACLSLILISILSFQSLPTLLITCVMTGINVACTTGFAVLVFQRATIHGSPIHASPRAMSWLSVLLSVILIVGPSVDRQAMILKGVLRKRKSGFDVSASLALAQNDVGHIIMVTGLILLIYALSQLVSRYLWLVHVAMVLAFSTSLDSLLVCPIVFTVLVNLTSDRIWWPHRYADPVYQFREDDNPTPPNGDDDDDEEVLRSLMEGSEYRSMPLGSENSER